MGKSRHHRLPKSWGGRVKFPPNNIKECTDAEHKAFNLLFGTNPTILHVASVLNEWTDPRYEIIVVLIDEEKKSDK